jgi:hypothetical protein
MMMDVLKEYLLFEGAYAKDSLVRAMAEEIEKLRRSELNLIKQNLELADASGFPGPDSCGMSPEDWVADLRKDSERLAYAYSGAHTGSEALVNLEFRLLNADPPTMREVRVAIDDAMAASAALRLPNVRHEGQP